MNKRGGNFFEEHVEKIVLGLVGLLCVWFLFTHVILGTNTVEYDRDTFGPSEIDDYINKLALELENELNGPPIPREPYDPCVDDYIKRMDLTIGIVDSRLDDILIPPEMSEFVSGGQKYKVPQVAAIGEALVERFRNVVYVPTEEINGEKPYEKPNSEPNDIDFVTVESTFEIQQLVESFHECFAGEEVKDEWRDPCLANPVLASIQLQRQQQLADGGWSDWQVVPRTRIDHRRGMFDVIEDVGDLPPGGLKVRLLRFSQTQTISDLLQPEAYRIASAEDDWFPPSIHVEYAKHQEKVETEERRKIKEEERDERDRGKGRFDRSGRFQGAEGGDYYGPRGVSTRGRDSRSAGRGFGPDSRRGEGRITRDPRGRGGRRQPGFGFGGEDDGEAAALSKMRGGRSSIRNSDKKFYTQFDEIWLSKQEENIFKQSEPVVFWAHDDTVEPGNAYRYRIRMGVFNPIAGTDKFREEDKSFKDDVILWSDFSYAKDTVEIPQRLYFFAESLTRKVNEDIVKVQVFKYKLGYWYGDTFPVKPGEIIGRAVENEDDKNKDDKKKGNEKITLPETINYSTGAVYLDTLTVENWTGVKNMRPKAYFDMLYTHDGSTIEHMPVQKKYWADGAGAMFNYLQEAVKREKKPWRDFGSKWGRRRRGTGGGSDFDDEDEEEMQMLERMGGGE